MTRTILPQEEIDRRNNYYEEDLDEVEYQRAREYAPVPRSLSNMRHPPIVPKNPRFPRRTFGSFFRYLWGAVSFWIFAFFILAISYSGDLLDLAVKVTVSFIIAGVFHYGAWRKSLSAI